MKIGMITFIIQNGIENEITTRRVYPCDFVQNYRDHLNSCPHYTLRSSCHSYIKI